LATPGGAPPPHPPPRNTCRPPPPPPPVRDEWGGAGGGVALVRGGEALKAGQAADVAEGGVGAFLNEVLPQRGVVVREAVVQGGLAEVLGGGVMLTAEGAYVLDVQIGAKAEAFFGDSFVAV
jgi:hypothetical protein